MVTAAPSQWFLPVVRTTRSTAARAIARAVARSALKANTALLDKGLPILSFPDVTISTVPY
ncbi:hypothetical protein SSBG_01979 [Streptomyces sp. SPB074]|nr:hypothetical protein SSBG_01979 [Streptomyces sp. SPB074]